MSRFLPRSLKGLLLLSEGTFLLLLAVTGGIGTLSSWHWHRSSDEAVRINALLQGAERIRGDMYGQIEEAIRARLTEDPSVLDRYTPYGKRIESSFRRLSDRARDEDERHAVRYLWDAYRIVLADMNKVFTTPYEISTAARMKLLDRAHEEWMLADFESALAVFGAIVAQRQSRLEEDLDRWTRLASILYPLPLALAVLLVVVSVRRLHRHVLRPMDSLIHDVQQLSGGDLAHPVREAGVAEVRRLARTFQQMARDLGASRDALVASERQAALGALVPVVAHNIRNPLASIRANAQLLDPEDGRDEVLETRQGIIDSVDRLERWLRALLSYLNPLEPRRRTVALEEVLDAAVSLVEPRAGRRGVRIERPRGGCAEHSDVDPDLLEQALYGLLNNAVEASPPGGTVSVALEKGPLSGTARLSIEDQGPGIGFDPRPTNLAPGPTTKSYGTGLGIPFAFKIVHAHDGRLEFRPGACGGTRVTVTLPTVTAAGASVA